MKPKLILCLALVLSGGLFGCSTTASHSGDEPKLYTYDTLDPVTGLPTDKGERHRVLTPIAERKLRVKLVKIARLLDQVIQDSAYNLYWDNVKINSPKDISNQADDDKIIFNFYYSYYEGAASGTGYIDLNRGDCRISVRAYFQENADKLKDEEFGRDIPRQNIFHQTLEGTDIVIDVEVATKDKTFVEALRNKLNK
jgi:hypothetical protein